MYIGIGTYIYILMYLFMCFCASHLALLVGTETALYKPIPRASRYSNIVDLRLRNCMVLVFSAGPEVG